MKIVVAHHSWAGISGANLVSAYVLKDVIDKGYNVAVASTYNLDATNFKRWFNIEMNLEGIKIYKLLPREIPFLGLYQKLLFYIPLSQAIKKERPDVVYVDNEYYKPVTTLKKKIRFSIIHYIHFPFNILNLDIDKIRYQYLKRYLNETYVYVRRYQNGFWNRYFRVFLRISRNVAVENPFRSADIVLTNSRYVAHIIRILWNEKPYIIYPPVNTKEFRKHSSKSFYERENSAVMIGRITFEKRIEDIIKAISLTRERPVLKIIGSYMPSTISYISRLLKLARDRNVRVRFYFNASRSDVIRILTSSRIFVHATIGEHFGISVVEAMAAGCPVIVHKSGGPYEDIIEKGRYGLYAVNIDDYAEKIDELTYNEDKWLYYHRKSIERSSAFDLNKFKSKLENVLMRI